MKLSIDALRRIVTQLEVGGQTQTGIARAYGMTANALAIQLKMARKRKLLPPVKHGRRNSLQRHCRDVQRVVL